MARNRRFVMHTDNPDVIPDSERKYRPRGKMWSKGVDHPEGVTAHYHDYGSVLYETNAPNIEEASRRIHKADEEFTPDSNASAGFAFRPKK